MAQRVPEKVVQQQIVAALRAIGGAVYVLGHPSPNDGRRHRGTGQTPGLPDLIAFVPNRRAASTACHEADAEQVDASPMLVMIEVKATDGQLSLAQREFRDRCLAAGVPHIMGGLDEVMAWLIGHSVITESHVPHDRYHSRQ